MADAQKFARLASDSAEERAIRARALAPRKSLAARCCACCASNISQPVVSLLKSVESGAILPIKGSWLVSLKETGGVLKRRDHTAPEAFWSPADLWRRAQSLGEDADLMFVAISHAPRLPQQDEMAGVYLQLVASVAKLYLGTSGYYTKAPAEMSPLAMAHLKAGLPEESSDFAVFWPFASLPPSQQQPWSNESAAWFRHAICWILPGDDGGGDGTTASSQPLAYATSGTCAVEAAISALANTGLRRLDLTKRTPDAMRKAYSGHDWAPADRLDRVCASWLPPRSPESFARFVEGKSFRDCCREGDGHGGGMEGMGDDDNDDNAAKAAASADAARACAVEAYRAAFDDATRAVHSLDFSRLGWSATELDELFLSLPRFTCLMQLNLSRNTFDGNAVRSFCSCMAEWGRQNAAIESVDVSSCELGAEGAAVLAPGVAAAPPSLTELNLAANFITNEGARSIADALTNGASCALRKLNLETNEIRTEGAEAIGTACAHHSSLTDLSLRDNLLKDEGAVALAAALSHRRPWGKRHRLRALDVRSNGIGERGAQALANCHLGDGLQIGVVIHLARTASGRFKVPGL